MATTKSEAELLLPQFVFDQAGRRIVLYGAIANKPALVTLERAPFSTSPDYLSHLPSTLQALKNLGANDVYFWYLASSGRATSETSDDGGHEDLKINLIYPCAAQHVKKYSRQGVRVVTETAAIYRERVQPFMQRKREQGRLNWVWNIIEGKTEVEDVIFRTVLGADRETGFLLAPDLNWDRKTMESLHLLAIVERRDLWSLRDLRKKHVEWLEEMRGRLVRATVETYSALEEDQLKLYVHYQPTYYHFHIHIVHVQLEAGGTQAVGKATGLESIISQLRCMEGDAETGMDSVPLTYTVGEASEMWTEVFEPMK